jgi:hypothetical protein
MRLFSRSPQRSTSTESDLQKANPCKEYCDLELIPMEQSDRPIGKVQSMLTVIENLRQNAIAALLAALTEEPELKIWQKPDRYGHIHWHVYDPCTGKSVSFASELEILSWIENHA